MSAEAGVVPPVGASQSEEVSCEAPVTKSYANVVGKPSLSKFEVEVSVVDGKSTVVVPDEVLQDSVPLWDDFLVGRFPDSAPHVAKIHVIVNKIWNLGDKSIKIDVFGVNDKMVKFRIRNASARSRVLRRGMWNICDMPMIVSKWTPVAEDAQPEIKSMPMWVVVKNVPPSMFSWPGLSFLVSPVGEPKRLHQETELVTCFDEAKIFVEVDLSKELPKTYYFKVKDEETCVHYEYPWLPPKCSSCERWGHFEEGCVINAGRKSPSPSMQCAELADKTSSPISASKVSKDLSGSLVTLPQEVVHSATTELEVSPHATPPNPGQALEEGEVAPASPKAISDSQEAGEWSTVSNSGGRRKNSPKSNSGNLEYGQVSILSKTHFDVLRSDEPDEDSDLNNSTAADNLADHAPPAPKKPVTGNAALRPVLPRNSKTGHRFLAGSSQKATDNIPSTVNKKSTKQTR